MGKIETLKSLYIGGNLLTGTIPSFLSQLTSLTHLYLNDNEFFGCIPEELASLCGTDVKLNNNPCLSHQNDFATFCSSPIRMLEDSFGCDSCEDGILNQNETEVDCGFERSD